MNAALAIITPSWCWPSAWACAPAAGTTWTSRAGRVGDRGFGTIFVFLLMAGEIYSTFTFLGGAGLRLRLRRRGVLHPRLRDAGLRPVLLPAAAVWRYATPRRLVSQADVFTARSARGRSACSSPSSPSRR